MSKPVLVLIDPVTTLAPGAAAPPDRLRPQDPDRPAVTVLDLGVTRGDGIFETLGVVRGHPQAMEPHLRRLARSAAMLDLPELDLGVIEEAVRLAVERHEAVEQLWVKVVVTRGVEGTDHPTAWAYAFEAEDCTGPQRDGIAVVRLDRGYRSDVAETSPWLLQGAKTLSYAVNKAALREAARRGADDVIFVSTDGYVLEGPTSTVIARFGERLVTPPTDLGILAGTTQAALFGIAERLGWTTEHRKLASEELERVDGLWLVSSGQQLRPVTTLDGAEVPREPELDARLLEELLARTS